MIWSEVRGYFSARAEGEAIEPVQRQAAERETAPLALL